MADPTGPCLPVRIIAIGQAAAGDDGVGLAIWQELCRRSLRDDVELLRAEEDVALLSLLQTDTPIILVDAVIGEPVGRVVELSPDDLARSEARFMSTHGIGVSTAIELAAVLAPQLSRPRIRIVAVTIAPPPRFADGLSPAIAVAVPAAVDRVLALVGG